MSGHSKWANIKRKKGAQDKVKGSMFGKLSRAITLSVIEGGGMPNPDLNVRLRLAIEKAKEFNMPKDTIVRAIEKGTGANATALKQVLYEGFGPHGIALLIEAATDNPNRTLAEVRNMLERHQGKLGSQGSVAYQFQKTGTIHFSKNLNKEDDIFQFAQQIGATDFDQDEDQIVIYFPYEQLGKVKDVLNGLQGSSPEQDYKPLNLVKLNEAQEKTMMNLLELLESLDDVQNVYTNLG